MLGTGVCIESWQPVQKAIEEVFKEWGADCGDVDRDLASFLLAQHVYHMRFSYPDDDLPAEKREHLEREWPNNLRRDEMLKKRIAAKLIEASDEKKVALDRRFLEAVEREFEDGKTVVFFTTNWDLLLERSFKPGADTSKVKHLHGSVTEPRRLYLPTETNEERYRSPDDRQYYGDPISHLWKYVAAAKTLWLYGLSLDPADAELAMVIRAGLSEWSETRTIKISARRRDLPGIRKRVSAMVAMAGRQANIIEDPVDSPRDCPPSRLWRKTLGLKTRPGPL